MNILQTVLRCASAVMLVVLFGPLSVSVRAVSNDVILDIPSLSIRASIVEIKIKKFRNGTVTWDTRNLGMRVGHLEGTASWGMPGNIVLGGHSELARRKEGIFYTLDQLKVGDTIHLVRGDETQQYTVTQTYLAELTDISAVFPTETDQLTLITCDTGSYEASTGTYDKRLIVVATRSL